MADGFPLETTEAGGSLRLAWDNRRVPKDWFSAAFLVVFLGLWVPATVVATGVLLGELPLFETAFLTFWCLVAWLVIPLILYTLLGRTWAEWVEVLAAGVTVGRRGLLAPGPRTFPLDDGLTFALGWYDDGTGGDSHESMVTLAVVRPGRFGRRRHLLGYWLAPAVKRAAFERVRAFAAERGIPLRTAVFGTLPAA